MNEAAWAAVILALINMIGNVILEFIRHYYRGNGRKKEEK